MSRLDNTREKLEVERNPDGTLKAGSVSLNPNGRPKGAKNFTTKVREALEEIAGTSGTSYEHQLIKRILSLAIVDGEPTMIKLLWNYLDGMPTQKIEGEFRNKTLEDLLDEHDLIYANATEAEIGPANPDTKTLKDSE